MTRRWLNHYAAPLYILCLILFPPRLQHSKPSSRRPSDVPCIEIPRVCRTLKVNAKWSNVDTQQAQLSPTDRAMRRVCWNLANCHATVQKLLVRQVLNQVSAVANWPARQNRAVDSTWRSVRWTIVVERRTSLTDDGPVYHALSVHLSRAKLITRVDDRYAVAKFSSSGVWDKVPEGSALIFGDNGISF